MRQQRENIIFHILDRNQEILELVQDKLIDAAD
jgi:hypothetical protein